MIWLALALLAALTGIIAGYALSGWRAVAVGAAVPWLGLLGWLLYHEYFVPYEGGGASMWPVAQLFAGTFVASIGGLAAAAVVWARQRRNR